MAEKLAPLGLDFSYSTNAAYEGDGSGIGTGTRAPIPSPYTGPAFSPGHSHRGSQPPVTPATGDQMLSFGFLRNQTCI